MSSVLVHHDFTSSQDAETSDMYQPYFFAEFEHEEDLARVPLGRQTIRVEIPVFDRDVLNQGSSGGVAIEHLQGLLRPENRVEGDRDPATDLVQDLAAEASRLSDTGTQESNAPSKRVVVVAVERSGEYISLLQRSQSHIPSAKGSKSPPADFWLSEMRELQLAKSLVQWGGFYSPKAQAAPLDVDTDSSSRPEISTTKQPNLQTKRMEAYKREWTPKIEEATTKWGARVSVGQRFNISKPEVPKEPETQKQGSEVVEQPPTEHRPARPARPAIQMIRPSRPEDIEASHPAAAPTPALEFVQSVATPKQAASKRRERLLELARKNAHKPLPESIRENTAQTKEAEPDAAAAKQIEEEKLKHTVRARLWKLMGGKWA